MNYLINQFEQKYTGYVKKVRGNNNLSFSISRKTGPFHFLLEKYTHEHMMRSFARYLNRGKLSLVNIERTISEMKSLQQHCR